MINDISKFALLQGTRGSEGTVQTHAENVERLQKRFPQVEPEDVKKIYDEALEPLKSGKVQRFNAVLAFKAAGSVLAEKAKDMTGTLIEHAEESQEPIARPKGLSRQIQDRIERSDYDRILAEHFSKSPEEVSKYYYFDTDEHATKAELLAHRIRFRLRERRESLLLQLLQYRQKGKEELLQEIVSPDQINAVMQGEIPEGILKEHLKASGISAPLEIVGMTESVRHTATIKDGYCELERTTYPDGKILYQVEYRSPATDTAEVRQFLGLSPKPQKAKSKLKEFFSHIGLQK